MHARRLAGVHVFLGTAVQQLQGLLAEASPVDELADLVRAAPAPVPHVPSAAPAPVAAHAPVAAQAPTATVASAPVPEQPSHASIPSHAETGAKETSKETSLPDHSSTAPHAADVALLDAPSHDAVQLSEAGQDVEPTGTALHATEESVDVASAAAGESDGAGLSLF